MVVLGTIALFLWIMVDSRNATRWNAFQAEENLLRVLEHDVSRNVASLDLSLQAVIAGLKQPEIWTMSEYLRSQVLFDTSLTAPYLGALIVLGTDGYPILASVPTIDQHIFYGDRHYFAQHRQYPNAGLLVSGAVRSKATGEWSVPLSRRMNNADGSFAGVVVGTIKLGFFQQLLRGLDLGKGSVGLIHAEGSLITRSPPEDGEIGRDLRQDPLYADFTRSPFGIFEAAGLLDDGWNLIAHRKIADLPLIVFAQIPERAVFEDWNRKAMVIGASMGVLIVVSIMLTAALSAELRRRSRAERSAIESRQNLAVMRDHAIKAQAAAEAANRVKSEFLANMSHELRTPLNAILGFSEMIRDAIGGPLELRYRGYGGDIHVSGQHLLSIINGMLDLAKIEAGHLELQERPVTLPALFADCLRLIMHQARKGGIETICDVPVDLPHITGDRIIIKQIIVNLLSNAVKFTDPGGRITISARVAHDGQMVISVSDTGIGMSPEAIPVALEPFRQIDSTISRRHTGTGLGLPLAKRMAELHGGSFSITSYVGMGTSVSIKLPSARVAPMTGSGFRRAEAKADLV